MIDIMNFFNECSEGVGERGLDSIPIEGMLGEMDRSGVGFWHMEKDNQWAYCQYLNLPAHLYRLISLSFSPFRVSSTK